MKSAEEWLNQIGDEISEANMKRLFRAIQADAMREAAVMARIFNSKLMHGFSEELASKAQQLEQE